MPKKEGCYPRSSKPLFTIELSGNLIGRVRSAFAFPVRNRNIFRRMVVFRRFGETLSVTAMRVDNSRCPLI
jgi:hypothetical protein